jgi:hypothetical protein
LDATIGLHEQVEDARQHRGRDTNSIIADPRDDFTPFPAQFQLDSPSRRGV